MPTKRTEHYPIVDLVSRSACIALLLAVLLAVSFSANLASAQETEAEAEPTPPPSASDLQFMASVRSGVEYDNNAYRVEAAHAEQDFLARYFATLDLGHSHGGQGAPVTILSIRHGAKVFFEHSDADTLLTQVEVGHRRRLSPRWVLLLDGDIKDRTERLSQRDYNRGGARLGLAARVSDFRLSLSGGWRYFTYKPHAPSSSHGGQLQTSARWFLSNSLALDLGYALAQRRSDVAALTLAGDVILQSEGGPDREDAFHSGRVGLSYRSKLFVDASYTLSHNNSNSYGHQLVRHALDLTLTTPLFWKTFLTARGELQRTTYGDPVLIDDIFIIDEDNRNALVASLARPIFESWEVEARYSLYVQEFGVGAKYSRQTVLFAIAYTYEGL